MILKEEILNILQNDQLYDIIIDIINNKLINLKILDIKGRKNQYYVNSLNEVIFYVDENSNVYFDGNIQREFLDKINYLDGFSISEFLKIILKSIYHIKINNLYYIQMSKLVNKNNLYYFKRN